MNRSVKNTAGVFRADNRPIGVFDSGLGGLTVVDAMSRRFPEEDFVYLGDTARVPYGDKSVDAIIGFARQDVDFLLRRGVKMIVVACNTVSAVAMNDLKKRYPDALIVGVIEAGVRAAVRADVKRLAVIGTRATVNSDSYRRGIHGVNPSIVVESIPCPLLVPLAEEGLSDSPIADAVLDLYLAPLKEQPPEAILLGCTHYPLFRNALNRYFAGGTSIIDSANACAEYVAEVLQEHHLAATPGKRSQSRFFVTDMHSQFTAHATRFLSRPPERVERVSLETDADTVG